MYIKKSKRKKEEKRRKTKFYRWCQKVEVISSAFAVFREEGTRGKLFYCNSGYFLVRECVSSLFFIFFFNNKYFIFNQSMDKINVDYMLAIEQPFMKVKQYADTTY